MAETEMCIQCGKQLDCGRCRGCCCSCYEKSAEQVRRGKTTWGALVVAGKVRTWTPYTKRQHKAGKLP